MMERWRVTPAEFDEALSKNPTDEIALRVVSERVAAEDIKRANDWLLRERVENLDRQDSEETAPVEHR